MLSNCILSMSTTFLPLFLPPLSSIFSIFTYLVSFPFGYSCPQTGPHLHFLWLTFLFCCVCKSRMWQRICHTHFTIRRILSLGVNASESRLMWLFAHSLCHISVFLFVHIGPISVWLVSIAVSVRQRSRDVPSTSTSWLVCSKWMRPGRGEGGDCGSCVTGWRRLI